MRRSSLARRVIFVQLAFVTLGLMGLLFADTQWIAKVMPRWLALILWSALAKDIARTLIIIGAVSLLLEIYEFADYFESRLLRVLVHREFLKKLDEKELQEVSVGAMRVCVAKASSNPHYKAEDLITQVHTDILPLVGKVYREGFRETVEIHLLSPADVEARLGLTANTIPPGHKVGFTKTITTFTFIGPDNEVEEPFSWWSSVPHAIPGVPSEKHIKMRIKVGDGSWEEVKPRAQEIQEEIRFESEKSIRIKGKTIVEMETEEYSYGAMNFVVNKMMYLTRGMTVSVISGSGPVEFESEIFGLLTSDTEAPHRTSNSIGLNYEGWLLPNDGYVIYADRKEVSSDAVPQDDDNQMARAAQGLRTRDGSR